MSEQQSSVAPVSFALSPADFGWIELTVTAGAQSDTIKCSDVYDPFLDLVDWAWKALVGRQGCVEIDEEGVETQLLLTREPGAPRGRLRVFEPGPGGVVGTLRIDAPVDCAQLAAAFHDAFSRYVPDYPARHWGHAGEPEVSDRRVLAEIDLRMLANTLEARLD